MAQYLEGLCDPFQDNSTDRATQARQLRGLQAGWRWRARNEVFFFGSGYRVYFGESANDLVILLCGGDKDSQERDIEKAKEYWQAYQEEQDEQETEKP